MDDIFQALECLGITVDHSPSRENADAMFEEVKSKIMSVGFENILAIPAATDDRTQLIVTLLNDAGECGFFISRSQELDRETIKDCMRIGFHPALLWLTSSA